MYFLVRAQALHIYLYVGLEQSLLEIMWPGEIQNGKNIPHGYLEGGLKHLFPG